MITHVAILLLAFSWQAAILPVRADTFESEWQSPSPELSPASPPFIEIPPPSPPPPSSPDEGPIPPDYLPKPPDGASPSPEDAAPSFPFTDSSLPRWAVSKSSNMFLREYRRNLALIAALDQSQKQADVLVYGDSITALNKPTNLSTGVKGSREPWNRNFGDLHAEPLGIPGDRIGNLMWRLAVGNERPSFKNPKVVVLFMGTNDCRDRTSTIEISSRMEFLLKWMVKAMPDTRIVVQQLFSGLSQAVSVNNEYTKLASKYGLTLSTCGRDIKKGDKTYMADKLHPNSRGQDLWLKCLRKVVQPLLSKKLLHQGGEGKEQPLSPPDLTSNSPTTSPPLSPASSFSLPAWVVGRNSSMFMREFRRNMDAITAIDRKKERMDIALYGDSITAWNKPLDLTKVPGSRAIWTRIFGDLNAEPLGIPGDRVATLIYRIAVLKEKPVTADPRVVILFAGINDIVHNSTAPDIPTRMDYLIRLVKKEMPQSKIVVQALLPSLTRAPAVNAGYAKVARKHGVVFSTCGQDIKRGDRTYMADILHPNEKGQQKVLGCLSKLVRPVL